MTSLGRPRIVVVHGATSARLRRGMAASRDNTTTGRRPMSGGSHHAELAETRTHHPDWTNVWNRVDVRLRTFDAGQSVTWYDVEMACSMSELAAQVEGATTIGWPLQSAPG